MSAGSKGTIQTLLLYFPLYTSATLPTWKNHKPCSFSTVPKNSSDLSSRQRKGKERKNGPQKFFSRLHVSSIHNMVCVRKKCQPIAALALPYVLCQVASRKHTGISFDFLNHPLNLCPVTRLNTSCLLPSCLRELLHETAQSQQGI